MKGGAGVWRFDDTILCILLVENMIIHDSVAGFGRECVICEADRDLGYDFFWVCGSG